MKGMRDISRLMIIYVRKVLLTPILTMQRRYQFIFRGYNIIYERYKRHIETHEHLSKKSFVNPPYLPSKPCGHLVIAHPYSVKFGAIKPV